MWGMSLLSVCTWPYTCISRSKWILKRVQIITSQLLSTTSLSLFATFRVSTILCYTIVYCNHQAFKRDKIRPATTLSQSISQSPCSQTSRWYFHRRSQYLCFSILPSERNLSSCHITAQHFLLGKSQQAPPNYHVKPSHPNPSDTKSHNQIVSRVKKMIAVDNEIIQCSSNATFVITLAAVRLLTFLRYLPRTPINPSLH